VLFNDEVDALVLGSVTAQDLQKLFESDFSRARPIDLAHWRTRSIGEKLTEIYSQIWQEWL